MFVIGTEALPHVWATAPQGKLSVDDATTAARNWLLADAAGAVDRGTVDGPFILPLVGSGSVNDYRTVVRVTLPARDPIGRWEVFVDANTAAPVARRQTLMFGAGTVLYDAPIRHPASDRMDYPADSATVAIGGADATTGQDGGVTWTGDTAATVTVNARGTFAKVNNDAGGDYSSDLSLDPAGTAVWSAAANEQQDAQISSYVHANIVKRYVRVITPNMDWLDGQIQVNVNINDNCNAFSDGDSINFFTSGGGCENTGRIADVVYHEFGHSYHAHSVIDGVGAFDGALSEGVSDYLAATITNDSGMGRGFFSTDQPLRELDPPVDKLYPDDVVGEVHADGEIIAGTLWDMRALLIDDHGYDEGVAVSDILYQAGISRAVDMPTMYPEILAADDDDGDLSNGTPNECSINEAFARHGMRSVNATVTPLGAEVPDLDGFHVGLGITGLSSRCGNEGIDWAHIEWQLRSDDAVNGEIDMTDDGSGGYEGVIPLQPEGEVVQYQVVVRFADGKEISYPDNAADPRYEFFVGTVEELYCTDFETDPATEGWTHGLTSGQASEGADDWQWDMPNGTAGSGDPSKAFSGERVYGNDLGHENFNGTYQSNKVNYALGPAVDTGNYTDVRLQYWRWLNVEDALYDQATIYVNDQQAWQNLASDEGGTHHKDKEWRFQDVDISQWIVDGKVQVKYEIASDGGLEMGGWTLDDFCIVAYSASVCGDGNPTGIEQCDDGTGNSDTAADACRTDCKMAGCGDGVQDTGEECDDGNDVNDDDCTNTCTRPAGFEEDGGGDCGCRVGARPRGSTAGLLLLGLGAFVALGARRRRRRR